MKIKRVVSVITLLLLLFESKILTFSETVKAEANSAPVFIDVPSDHWAKTQIDSFVKKGIVNGYADGSFKPSNGVTREEFCKLLVATFDVQLEVPNVSSFADIDKNRWSYQYIETCKEFFPGYIDKSDGTNKFMPTQYAVREDIASAIAKAMGCREDSANNINYAISKFSDGEAINHKLLPYVSIACEKGLISGYPDGSFGPQKGITRAETVALLERAVKQAENSETNEKNNTVPTDDVNAKINEEDIPVIYENEKHDLIMIEPETGKSYLLTEESSCCSTENALKAGKHENFSVSEDGKRIFFIGGWEDKKLYYRNIKRFNNNAEKNVVIDTGVKYFKIAKDGNSVIYVKDKSLYFSDLVASKKLSDGRYGSNLNLYFIPMYSENSKTFVYKDEAYYICGTENNDKPEKIDGDILPYYNSYEQHIYPSLYTYYNTVYYVKREENTSYDNNFLSIYEKTYLGKAVKVAENVSDAFVVDGNLFLCKKDDVVREDAIIQSSLFIYDGKSLKKMIENVQEIKYDFKGGLLEAYLWDDVLSGAFKSDGSLVKFDPLQNNFKGTVIYFDEKYAYTVDEDSHELYKYNLNSERNVQLLTEEKLLDKVYYSVGYRWVPNGAIIYTEDNGTHELMTTHFIENGNCTKLGYNATIPWNTKDNTIYYIIRKGEEENYVRELWCYKDKKNEKVAEFNSENALYRLLARNEKMCIYSEIEGDLWIYINGKVKKIADNTSEIIY
ncbi:MAG: S-layer homology domain-containing protein [Clostridia bacterium]|nr:S-layer homology domain-containing protein [Clostridia bacterium]